MSAIPLYDESNYRELLGDGRRVWFDGHWRMLNAMAPKHRAGECPWIPKASFDPISREQWPDLIAQKDAEKSWLEDLVRQYNVKCGDQNGLGYCHAYGCKDGAVVARLIANHEHVDLSAESIGGPVTGWRNRGAYPEDDMKQLSQYGACPASMMDRPWSLSPHKWDPDWETERLNYRAYEWEDLRVGGPAFDMAATAVLLGKACSSGFSWWSHFFSGPYRLYREGNRYVLRYRNTWGMSYGDQGFMDYVEGRGTPTWCYAVRAMTPQDRE